MKLFLSLFISFTFCFGLTGCAGFQSLVDHISGVKQPQGPIQPRKRRPKTLKKYSDIKNYSAAPEREYKRMTRKKMSEQARLQQNSGSLWQEQGQSGYFFTENPLKMIGDHVGVEITGDPKEQLKEKVNTVKKLLKKLKDRRKKARKRLAMKRRMRRRSLAEANGTAPAKKRKKKKKTPEKKAVAEEKPEELDFKKISTRVVEQLPDGNYRVKGSQPLMISQREYRVIVDGIARPEDFDGDGVKADKLMDAKFDVVSTRRKGSAVWQ